MGNVFAVIAPVFLVVIFGYAAVWAKIVSDDSVDHLMKVNQNILTPCLLFTAIYNLDLAANFDPILLLTYYSGAIVSYVAGVLGGRFIFGRPWDQSIAIGFCCLFSNSVLLGLPVMERAFGSDALGGNYAIISVHAPMAYVIGIISMEIARADGGTAQQVTIKVGKAVFGNALIIGLALGFAANLSPIAPPNILTEAIALLARAAIPVAVFALGGVLVRYRPEGDLRTILYICAISLFLHPAIVWVTGTQINLETDAMRSSIVTAAMAPGINVYIFANMYNAAKRVAASTVLIGTALTFLTSAFWISLIS